MSKKKPIKKSPGRAASKPAADGPPKKSIVVTVSDAALQKIDELAERLSSKGMTIDRVMPITGVITGTCAPVDLSSLESMHGVSAVEEEVGVQLPDPDSPVQ